MVVKQSLTTKIFCVLHHIAVPLLSTSSHVFVAYQQNYSNSSHRQFAQTHYTLLGYVRKSGISRTEF